MTTSKSIQLVLARQLSRSELMIDRRRFIRAAGASLAMATLTAKAQQAKRLPRIGILYAGKVGDDRESLRQGFRDLGYVDGGTVVFEWRWWQGQEQLRDAVAELVRLKPDVIVVGGSEGTKALKEATRSIPIVFVGPSYPVEEGLVDSFARPGGNVTGVTAAQSDHVAKSIQLLLDIVPTLSEVSVIWSPTNAGSAFTLRDMNTAASGLKVKLSAVPMTTTADVEPALAAVARAHPGALVVLPAPTPAANTERISELAIRLRIPSITAFKSLMERGLLLSYGADFREVETRIPGYVDRILKGAKPADMPVERPTRFELGINMKTAKAIGVTIPQSLLVRADTVIK
jgi:putative ABC transport system substrate-binding protein